MSLFTLVELWYEMISTNSSTSCGTKCYLRIVLRVVVRNIFYEQFYELRYEIISANSSTSYGTKCNLRIVQRIKFAENVVKVCSKYLYAIGSETLPANGLALKEGRGQKAQLLNHFRKMKIVKMFSTCTNALLSFQRMLAGRAC